MRPERVYQDHDAERRRMDFESMHALHQNKDDQEDLRGDQQFYIHLPFSDLGEWIYEKDEIYKAFDAFPAWRLSNIRQLSFLAYIGPNPEIQYMHEFNQTRFLHTLLVAKTMEVVLRRNHAPEELVKKGIAVAMAHDQATPGLGDATKKLDPDSLNEEDFWDEVMEPKGWDYLESINMSKEEMNDAIHNKGLLGKLLDVVDRVSYVMVDLDNIISTENLESIINGSQDFGYRSDLAKILVGDTNVGSIYKDISINWDTEEVSFNNPERLSKFLEIRGLLHKYLYMHPISQARDKMVFETLRPFYSTDESDKSKLTPKRLRKMSDGDVLRFIAGIEEDDYDTMSERYERVYAAFVRWFPQFYTKTDTMGALEERKREIELNEDLKVNGVVVSNGFNPSTNLLVLNDNGQTIPFRQYDEQCAGRIERIAESTKGYILFWQKKGRRVDLEYNPDLVRDFPTNFMPIL